MPNHELTDEERKKGGHNSKRKPLDEQLKEFFEKYINANIKEGDDRTRKDLMFDAAYKEFLKGNQRPLAYLVDRGFGKAKNHIELSGSIDIPPAQIVIDGKVENSDS